MGVSSRSSMLLLTVLFVTVTAYSQDTPPDPAGYRDRTVVLVITPSTKLMTLFGGRRIGRGVRENNSSPTWA